MFKLDPKGICETCIKKALDSEIIRCHACQFYFHAICDSDEGNGDDFIAKKTHLGLHKMPSTKKNFMWKCNKCLTVDEANQAATVKDMVSSLLERFNLLESNLESRLKEEINTQVKQEFERLTASQSEEFVKLSASISTIVPDPAKASTVWNNPAKVEDIKASLMVRPDKDGKPVDREKVKKIILENGVPVNKVVVSSSGDTFINLPNNKSRDKLRPLLESENEVVLLKKKLPQVSLLGVTDNLTKDDIKLGICSQNEVIGNLVKDGHELTVIYTRAPPAGKYFHHVTIRVSSDIRAAIKAGGNKIFLCQKVCTVVDNFHVKRCNKCQSFGHYAATCKEEVPVVCGYCAEHHKSSDCLLRDSARNTHKCINCQVAALDPEGHSTFSLKCPAYIIQQDKLKSSIAYDYSLN